MAQMHPVKIADDQVPASERTLFRQLKEQLSDEFTVLHSVHWLSLDGGRAADGEADFVIAHPDLGILVLEVKGGTIRLDSITGQWTSEDVGGTVHEIKDPFLQAERTMHRLNQKLATSPSTCGYSFPFARSVAFPDVILPEGDLGPNVQRDIIIDSSNLFFLIGAIRKAMMARGKTGPGWFGVRALVELLRPSLEFSRPGLAAQIKIDEFEVERLTHQQLILLDMLQSHRQVAINGTAGSGKTILAMEQVRRLARQGFRVLFTCFNKALAKSVRQRLQSEPGVDMNWITVSHYHDLAASFARRAGIALPTEDEAARRPDAAAYFNEELPQHLLDSLATNPDRFDAIVVDEGQDFADIWMPWKLVLPIQCSSSFTTTISGSTADLGPIRFPNRTFA